ncbi:hypothetical protein CJJ23_00230 [Mycoplasmopsis agassizii]|uniref:Uncharacterized protein n=1 Tax=Mycoplasmopsis agassizii TaxID=33922 RepID=A0A269TLE1_9BACT|nr:hypothetical protein [Mycoplasmopsis agassizii]PAK21758.1 hypothetical protein CJJ23_00230 [Mycoplasmopsis agassizii]
MNSLQMLETELRNDFYIISFSVLVGLNILLYLWFWFVFYLRNQKQIIKYTKLESIFINYNLKPVYKRHVIHVILKSSAIAFYLILAWIIYIDTSQHGSFLNLENRNMDFQLKNMLWQTLWLFFPMAIAVTLFFISLSWITSFLFLRSKNKKLIEAKIDFSSIIKLANFDYHYENLFTSGKFTYIAYSLYYSFWIFWWFPAVFAEWKMKKVHRTIKDICIQDDDHEIKKEKIYAELSYIVNYIWHQFVFFRKSYKKQKIQDYLGYVFREIQHSCPSILNKEEQLQIPNL